MREEITNQIVIVDAGGQYCHLIARRVREAGVQSRICIPEEVVEQLPGAKGIIISGGPSSVYVSGSPSISSEVLETGVPILGICYGHQLLAQKLGGVVRPGASHEYGKAKLQLVLADTLL